MQTKIMEKKDVKQRLRESLMLKKILTIMKLTTFLILLTFMQVSAVGFSQSSKITMDFKNQSLEKIFSYIEQNTDYSILYKNELIERAPLKSGNYSDKEVLDVLTDILKEEHLSYDIKGKIILIVPDNSYPVKVSQEEIKITGQVSDDTGQPLPGVTVVVKGTTMGTITDADGRYSIAAAEDATLEFTFIGMDPQTVDVAGRKLIDITMRETVVDVDEVVVVGYGVQKKSVVTASIAKVSSNDLKNVAPVRIDDALKGLAAGVSVTSVSGQPGAGSTIRVRGTGTINNSSPLYIIDGMPVDDGIGYLNPNDIESIEVLKDAASGAVYGARAANGVILVTTKNGQAGKTKVSYDFSYSLQNPWRKRDVLNATEYAIMMNEGSLNSGSSILYNAPYSYGSGTDWQDEVFYDNAPEQNHQLSISGASDKIDYYLSFGYLKQDGIIGGDWNRSNYDRLSVRSNTNYTVFDNTADRTWLNKLKIGLNVNYSHIKQRSITANSEFGSILGSAVTLSPILGVYYPSQEEEDAAYAYYEGNSAFTAVTDDEGRLYTIAGSDYNEITNHIAQLSLPGAKDWADKIISNMYAELSLWKSLRFKTAVGIEQNWYGEDGWTKMYYLNNNNNATYSSVYSSMNKAIVWQIENTLLYDFKITEHSVNIVLGQSAQKSTGRSLGASRQDLMEEDEDKANIDFATGLQADGKMAASGGEWDPHSLSSYFGRISYNYAERYMLQLTVRRDGSSNFGANHRCGTFPSFSLGWNITNEAFMDKRPKWLTNTKIRFSWGKNGNENIGHFGYVALTATGNNYVFGKGSSQGAVSGVTSNVIPNEDLRWEESEQTNGGLDFGFFKNSLTLSVDYYLKRTNGMLITMPIPSYNGENAPTGNVGEMENRGLEFELSYKFNFEKWSCSINANASYIKNKLIDLGNENGYQGWDNVQGLGYVSYAKNGEEFPYFYGYKSNGIFQNQTEIDAYVNADGEKIQPDAVPGDVRWVDVDGNGAIDSDDETKIGKGTPDWIYGFSFRANYKNIDFSMMIQGTVGNDIYDATRRVDINSANLPSYMLNRWTGEGTSNKYPRFSYNDQTNWGVSSDLYVTEGSYMRLKNIQLGYTLPQNITKKFFISNLRFYVAAENLLTFTKYAGFDPEISEGSSSTYNIGIDRGIYPQSKTYIFGLNLNF
jgi:TonB-linked SusC/RagA family outer membrane protein